MAKFNKTAVINEVIACLEKKYKGRFNRQEPFVAFVETVMRNVPNLAFLSWNDVKEPLKTHFKVKGWILNEDVREHGNCYDPIWKFEPSA